MDVFRMAAAKIMIVDDDLDMRELLGYQLRDLGHEPVYAVGGEEALALVQRERPDLMLLDLALPGGDGFLVLERLLGVPDWAMIPVIVFSGMSSPQAEERALELGARDFIHKSLRGTELVEAIAIALLVAVVAQHTGDLGLAAQAPGGQLARSAA